MMPKPLIGITTTQLLNPSRHPAFGVNVAYTDAVSAAGGLPVLIPLNLSNDELDESIVPPGRIPLHGWL